MTHNQQMIIGALIGLARATEGKHQLTFPSTHEAMLQGMQAAHQIDLSDESCQALLDQIWDEKDILVPRCHNCATPCGRNDDFDMAAFDALAPELRAEKLALLEKLLHDATEAGGLSDAAKEQAMKRIYRGFFYLGYDCNIDDLREVASLFE